MAGRRWSVAVNVATVKRVRTLLDVDLLAVPEDAAKLEDHVIYRLMADPEFACDVLFAVCEPQARDAGITDEAFAEAMGGGCLEAGTLALLDEWSDFFPSRRDRERARRAKRMLLKLIAASSDMLDAIADQVEGGLDHLWKPSTSSRAMSAWTRIRGRFASLFRWRREEAAPNGHKQASSRR